MQTAINLNADSEWDGIAQTIKKSLVKVQVQAEANQKELKKELNEKFEDSKKELNMKLDAKFEDSKKEIQELNAKFDKEMAEIKAMLIKNN